MANQFVLKQQPLFDRDPRYSPKGDLWYRTVKMLTANCMQVNTGMVDCLPVG